MRAGVVPAGTAVFLGAFLFFLVQPLAGKAVLPWFGGTPAVWTTSLLFFQAVLLAGYGYSHLVATRLSPSRQAIVHLALVAVSLAFLPVAFRADWVRGGGAPAFRVLAILALGVGGPALVLSTTSPLVQDWYARACPGRSPYPLYALSNLASLGALALYPFAVEPALSLAAQRAAWSAGFGAYAAIVALLALGHRRHGESPGIRSLAPETATEAPAADRTLWFLLSFAGSLLLLATTSQLSLDLAVVPLLWVAPLAIYLATLVLAFASPRAYSRRIGHAALAVTAFPAWAVLHLETPAGLALEFGVYAAALAAGCMVCHGELAAIRPGPRHLTSYYLVQAAGGALGGLFAALVAPVLYSSYREFDVALALALVLALVVDRRRRSATPERRRWVLVPIAGAALLVLAVKGLDVARASLHRLETSRNFFGVLEVVEEGDGESRRRTLRHGGTIHGYQYLAAGEGRRPTAYYGPSSGAGVAIRFHPHRASEAGEREPLSIGVVGLGVGTIAAYGEEGDRVVFYEVNPEVERIARERFTFLADTPGRVEVVQGDARLSMEEELGRRGPRGFDVLVVDAFNGGTIPVHLLTLECFELYLVHLAPDGILAFHVSNRYLDLSRVLRALARESRVEGFQVLWFHRAASRSLGTEDSRWVVMTANLAFLDSPGVREAATPWPAAAAPPVLWTDGESDLFEILVLD